MKRARARVSAPIDKLCDSLLCLAFQFVGVSDWAYLRRVCKRWNAQSSLQCSWPAHMKLPVACPLSLWGVPPLPGNKARCHVRSVSCDSALTAYPALMDKLECRGPPAGSFPRLRSLACGIDWRGDKIAPGISRLNRDMPLLQSLALRVDMVAADLGALLGALRLLPSLTELDLASVAPLIELCEGALPVGLRSLRLRGLALRGDGAALAPLTALSHLSIDGTDMGGRALRTINALTHLEHLSLCGLRDSRQLVHLRDLSALTHLDLEGCPLTDARLEWLRSVYPRLARLEVSLACRQTGRPLANFRRLAHLRVEHRAHSGHCACDADDACCACESDDCTCEPDDPERAAPHRFQLRDMCAPQLECLGWNIAGRLSASARWNKLGAGLKELHLALGHDDWNWLHGCKVRTLDIACYGLSDRTVPVLSHAGSQTIRLWLQEVHRSVGYWTQTISAAVRPDVQVVVNDKSRWHIKHSSNE